MEWQIDTRSKTRFMARKNLLSIKPKKSAHSFHISVSLISSQQTLTFSKSAIEILEKGMIYVQS